MKHNAQNGLWNWIFVDGCGSKVGMVYTSKSFKISRNLWIVKETKRNKTNEFNKKNGFSFILKWIAATKSHTNHQNHIQLITIQTLKNFQYVSYESPNHWFITIRFTKLIRSLFTVFPPFNLYHGEKWTLLWLRKKSISLCFFF